MSDRVGKELALDPDDRACLAGERGEGMRLAAQLVTALGRIYGAEKLVPVASVQVAGVSYRNLGAAGLEFLRDWAETGARVRVAAMLNPAGMDLVEWRRQGIPEEFGRQQMEVIDAYRRLGVAPACTCTPYLVGNVPGYGQHLAWSESSAVVFANSILGARTNREGGPSALAAAILGKTACYGLHLDEGRRATLVVDVNCSLRDPADFGALGYMVGRIAGDGVPLLRLRRGPEDLGTQADLLRSPFLPHLKALGAAMAASGAVGLFHIAGVTPEAREWGEDIIAPGAARTTIEDLTPALCELGMARGPVDMVSIGCPHASLSELAEAAELLQGRRVTTALWITSARATLEEARRQGMLEPLERAGAKVMADTCLVVAPVRHLGYHAVATNSAKLATYAPGHCGLAPRFGPLGACLEAAVAGTMPDA